MDCVLVWLSLGEKKRGCHDEGFTTTILPLGSHNFRVYLD